MGNQQTAYPFTEKDIEILVKTSGKSEGEVRQWYSDFCAATNNTQRMNKRQFDTFYSRLRRRGNREDLTNHIFRAFDADNSGRSIRRLTNLPDRCSSPFAGTIDFREFLLAYIATTDGSKEEKFRYAFEVFDVNDDQRIDKREAKKILGLICRLIGLSPDEADCYTTTVMLSFDTNGDKVLTKTEFVTGCLHDTTLGQISNPFNF